MLSVGRQSGRRARATYDRIGVRNVTFIILLSELSKSVRSTCMSGPNCSSRLLQLMKQIARGCGSWWSSSMYGVGTYLERPY